MIAQRKRLPDRRQSKTFDIETDGLKYRATVSKFADGRIAEIFLANHKSGSDADTAEAAALASITGTVPSKKNKEVHTGRSRADDRLIAIVGGSGRLPHGTKPDNRQM
jgi:hypothetical protein